MEMMSPDGDISDDDSELNDETFDLGTAPAIPFIQKMFGGGAEKSEKRAEDSESAKGGKGEKTKKKRRRFMEQYCTNLTERARDGKLDRII